MMISSLGIFLFLIVLALTFGDFIFRAVLGRDSENFGERMFFGFGLGAGALSLGVLVVGLAGILYARVVWGMLSILFLLLLPRVKKNFSVMVSWLKKINSFTSFEKWVVFALGFVWFFTLMGSLSPILGMDAASYHMQDPKLFIQAHCISVIPYTRESLWPFLVQMLFTLGLLLKGEITAKLFHFAFNVFSILGIYVLCRRFWERAQALFAAVVFGLIPAIFTGTVYAYTDMAVVFYTTLSFYGFFVWRDDQKDRWFYLSGAACGFLLGVKITSAIVPALILVLCIFETIKNRVSWARFFKIAPGFLAVMFTVCGIWYLRSWVILGNPVYPFAGYLFGGHGYAEQDLRYQTTSGIGVGPVQFFKLLWSLTFYPDRFGGESIGVIFLIFLPMAIFFKKISKFVKYVFFITLSLYVSWFIVYQYVRFFYPTLIFLSILTAYVVFELKDRDKIVSKIFTGIVTVLFCYSAVLSVYHNVDKLAVVFGKTSRHDFLMKNERTFEMAEYINQSLPKDAKVLVLSEPRFFYIDRDAAMATLMQRDLLRNKVISEGGFEPYLRLHGYGEYLLFKKDLADPNFKYYFVPGKNLFAGYKLDLIKQTVFHYKDENCVYELWHVGEKLVG